MGQKISDGKAFNLTVPSNKVINDYDLYRVTGINGVAVGSLLATDVARTLAFEADPPAVYSVKCPSGISPAPGDLLYWATNDDTTYQDGALNLQTTPAANDDGPCFFVTKAKNANNYVQGRVLNGGTGVATIDVSQQARVGQLTDNSGGAAADGTIGAITMPTDSPATADALRDDLVANALKNLQDAVKELSTKTNAIETALHASGVTL